MADDLIVTSQNIEPVTETPIEEQNLLKFFSPKIGNVEDLPVGSRLNTDGVTKKSIAGEDGAYAIILNDQNYCTQDSGEAFFYFCNIDTDLELIDSLKKNKNNNYPVRICRSCTLESIFSPLTDARYDGLYLMNSFDQRENFLIFYFLRNDESYCPWISYNYPADGSDGVNGANDEEEKEGEGEPSNKRPVRKRTVKFRIPDVENSDEEEVDDVNGLEDNEEEEEEEEEEDEEEEEEEEEGEGEEEEEEEEEEEGEKMDVDDEEEEEGDEDEEDEEEMNLLEQLTDDDDEEENKERLKPIKEQIEKGFLKGGPQIPLVKISDLISQPMKAVEYEFNVTKREREVQKRLLADGYHFLKT